MSTMSDMHLPMGHETHRETPSMCMYDADRASTWECRLRDLASHGSIADRHSAI